MWILHNDDELMLDEYDECDPLITEGEVDYIALLMFPWRHDNHSSALLPSQSYQLLAAEGIDCLLVSASNVYVIDVHW